MANKILFYSEEIIERRAQENNLDIDILRLLPGVKTIQQFAFHHCHNLGRVDFPDTLETIEKFAFRDCPNLTCINLPDNLTTVEEFAFSQTGIILNKGIILINRNSPLALLVEIGSESVEGLIQIKDRIVYIDE